MLYCSPIYVYYYSMKKKSLFLLFLTVVFFILPLGAEDTEDAVFTPFVTRMQGELRNNLVRLSWVDSPHVRGSVYLYRSSLPFEGTGPFRRTGTRLVEIPYGAQSFIDEIDVYGIQGNSLYYFAAASDETGRSYDIPISLTNTVEIQIHGGNAVNEPAPYMAPEPPARFTPSGISSLDAAVQGDKVIITFSKGSVESASLYRSTKPINEIQDLLGSVIVQTRINSPYTDYPVPGIPYYYAVIAEEDVIRGSVEIIQGRNVTRSPVVISAAGQGDSRTREIRAMPLPQLSSGAAIPLTYVPGNASTPAELSAEAAKALGSIPARNRNETTQKKPRVFSRDLEASNTGAEEYALGSIVRGTFTSKNWNSAREELTRFLALPRTADNNARARFYLGQCYYFLNQNREALFEFLAIQEKYPSESREWIEACLTNPAQ